MFAVGVAKDREGLNETELQIIASDPDKDFAFYVDDWVALQSIRHAVASRACEGSNIKQIRDTFISLLCHRNHIIHNPSFLQLLLYLHPQLNYLLMHLAGKTPVGNL